MKTLKILAAAAMALVSLSGFPVHAQTFPGKPVRIVTPFPAGAGPDIVLKALAEKLQRKWGQPVTVENRPGSDGMLAVEAFKQRAADGHELIHLDNVQLVAYPHLFKKLPYDPAKDFEPLAPLFLSHFFVTVPANSRYKTVGDLLADAKAYPHRLNYGSWSIGNPAHLGGALLETMTDTRMQHVVYKESSQLYAAVGQGEVGFALGTPATVAPMLKAGKVRLLAVAAARRQQAFPEVPTVTESGGPVGFEVTGWTAIAAPKGLASPVAEKIQKDVEAALAEPDLRSRYAGFGYESFPTTPALFKAFVAAESAKYRRALRQVEAALD